MDTTLPATGISFLAPEAGLMINLAKSQLPCRKVNRLRMRSLTRTPFLVAGS